MTRSTRSFQARIPLCRSRARPSDSPHRGRRSGSGLGGSPAPMPHRTMAADHVWRQGADAVAGAPGGVIAGPEQLPDGDHASHAIRSIAGSRNGAAHGFDFQKAKGRLPSSRAIFSRGISLSILRLATNDFRCRFSWSSTATSRLFTPASPPVRKRFAPFCQKLRR